MDGQILLKNERSAPLRPGLFQTGTGGAVRFPGPVTVVSRKWSRSSGDRGRGPAGKPRAARVLITGPGRIARLPGAVGQVAAERRTKGPEGCLTGAVSARDMQASLG